MSPSQEQASHPAISADRKVVQIGYLSSAHLNMLREQFPYVRPALLQLLSRQEIFRELCDELAICNEVIERLSESAADEFTRNDYVELRGRVKRELIRYIAERGNCRL
jgi:hypothetical protein